MASMTTNFPTRKVIAGTLAGAITTILLWAVQRFVLTEPLPTEIAGAILTIVTAVVSYMVPPAAADQVVIDPAAKVAPDPSKVAPPPMDGQVP